ncbi:ribosomal-protein-alanine N-acetyltransferase [Filimonas lacunae]|uniref:Ribosomal-protein-alanine N-acetyltransferase n=1 Tax=Filimonas lacunae TaxID=477680 RepID=A0A173MFF9_9BACT|nr:GNAT family N-acetyltransferase [Filimonas lacunae]BAV06219.1 acetyltransferase, GNAT family [Filimonas lacunae]SIT25325.1 ribosomal-protein-alanine N-acetyltransferase [Filimonas lacunae]
MLSLNFTPFPQLRTPRLLLRQLSVSDTNHLYYLRSQPDIMQYILRPLHKNAQETQQYIQMLNDNCAANESVNWAITLQSHPQQLIGTIGYVRMHKEDYRAEVGYLLHHHYHRQGLMHEALQAVLHYGFTTLQLNSVMAITAPANTGSNKTLEKCGFQQEGHLKESNFFEGAYYDSLYWALLARQYRR